MSVKGDTEDLQELILLKSTAQVPAVKLLIYLKFPIINLQRIRVFPSKKYGFLALKFS